MRILHSRKLIFVSKPRCGSTSVRRTLSKLMVSGDIEVDTPNHDLGLHPHMSAPAIHAWLHEQGIDPNFYTTFIITRNPFDMLWSYYNFFLPDMKSRYNYSREYDDKNIMPFLEWLERGRVGVGKYWAKFLPSHVRTTNLSPLSLEAHILNEDDIPFADQVLKIEESRRCEEFLCDQLGEKVEMPRTNGSGASNICHIPIATREKIAAQFPMETRMYSSS